MQQIIPKASKVEMASGFLKIDFDNGEIKYLRSHLYEDMIDSFSAKEGKGKRTSLLTMGHHAWLGAKIKVMGDGTVVVNENDRYTPDELWNESQENVYIHTKA